MAEEGTKEGYKKDRLEVLRSLFVYFDKDKDGMISVDELRKIVKHLGEGLSEVELEQITKTAILQCNGKIDLMQFLVIMEGKKVETSLEKRLIAAFREYDANDDGFITKQELKETVDKLGISLTDEELVETIQKADINGDGMIDYEEFVQLMTSK